MQSASVLVDFGALVQILFEKQAANVVPSPVPEQGPSVALYILHESTVPWKSAQFLVLLSQHPFVPFHMHLEGYQMSQSALLKATVLSMQVLFIHASVFFGVAFLLLHFIPFPVND